MEDLNGEEVYNPPNDVEKPVVKETLVTEVINEVPNNVAVAAPSSSPPVPIEEAPKKSYASIVGFRKLFSSLHLAEHHMKFISLTAYIYFWECIMRDKIQFSILPVICSYSL